MQAPAPEGDRTSVYLPHGGTKQELEGPAYVEEQPFLAAVLITWKNQYSLTCSTVPESLHTLLMDLENTECIMMEPYNGNRVWFHGIG